MAMKLVSVLLTILAVVSAYDKVKRQSGFPDASQFNEYFGQIQENLKPITGQFPSMPNGFTSFPNFPGFPSGSTGSNSESKPNKRQINQQSFEEFLNKLKETGSKFTEKFPTGQFPSQSQNGQESRY